MSDIQTELHRFSDSDDDENALLESSNMQLATQPTFLTWKQVFVTIIPWPSMLVSLLFLVIAYFGTSPQYDSWSVTRENEGIYDYPKKEHEHVPNWALAFVVIGAIIVLVLTELFCVRSGTSRDRRVLAIFLTVIFLDGFLVTVSVTQLGKNWVAEPRPDFLNRCLGTTVITDAKFDVDGKIICVNGEIPKEGRLSFPSGHSSLSIYCGLFTSIYLIWTIYLRPIKTMFRDGEVWASGIARQVIHTLSLLCLGPLIIGMAVVASRVVDHRHSPADVTAGSLLGALFAILTMIRTISGMKRTFQPTSLSRRRAV